MALTYLQWNDLLARHFFTEEKAGKEVLLYVNEPLTEELGGPHGVGLAEFVEAAKTGPPWVTKSGFCQKALQAFHRWRERDLDHPPYIAYLGIFVLAAGREGNYASHAYYPRLHDLLGEQGVTGAPPSFARMIDLWDDLEKWSREDHHENYGRFVARIRGPWWRVGLPLSQTLISEDERKHLPLLLSDRGLDPLDLPSPEVILRLLRETGGVWLQRSTMRVLDGVDDDSRVLRDALSEVVLEELEAWDGSVVEGHHHRQLGQGRARRTALRLCLKHDALAQRVTCRVRLRTAAAFPEDGCTFDQGEGGYSWICQELFGGWSNALHHPASLQELDGSTLDWGLGECLLESDNKWTATLRPATTRVFTPGQYDGLPDYVERQRLERSTPFLIATTSASITKILEWGEQYCSNFKHHSTKGLPPGWTLLSGKDARRSCPGVEVLTISTSVRLLVRGGVKTGQGNVYLKGAPPYIVLENALGTETVTLDTQELEREDGHGHIWQIPEDVPEGKPLRIEAHTQEQPLRKVIRFESPHLPLRQDYTPFHRDSAGAPSKDSQQYVYGPVVRFQPGNRPPEYPPHLPLNFSSHIRLIGERPGQIAVWSEDGMPEWRPVWAIVKTGPKQARVIFCGTEEQAARAYTGKGPKKDKSLVRRWKKAVWHNRKRILPPELGALRDRWREYMEVAKRVQ